MDKQDDTVAGNKLSENYHGNKIRLTYINKTCAKIEGKSWKKNDESPSLDFEQEDDFPLIPEINWNQ